MSRLEISKVPTVIMEIIMGVVVGPYALGLVGKAVYLDFLAQTGFLFLIFLAGVEINLAQIVSTLPQRRLKFIDFMSNPLLVALFIYFGSLAISLPVAYFMSLFISIDLIFYTLLFPTVALSITVPILKADGKLSKKFGQIMLMEGAIATIMSIILISIYSGILKNGFQVELLLFSVIFVVFVAGYFVGQRLIKMKRFQHLLYRLEHAASQIRVRGTVVLLLLFVLVAHWIESELIMGAFFAGTLLSLFVTKERSALLFKLDGMSYGFFIPIFFIMVGVKLELSALAQFADSIPFILTLVIGFFFTQIVPTLIMVKVFGWKKALAGGVLNTARLGLTIATSQVGLGLGVITPADNAGIVAAAILTSLMAPLAYKIFDHEREEHFDIYILGGNRASLLLAERIKMHGISCMTFLKNEQYIREFERKHISHRKVTRMNAQLFKKLNIRPTDLIIILTENNSLNLELTRFFHNVVKHGKIFTKRQAMTHEFIKQPNITMIDTDEILAKYVEEMIVSPDSVSALSESFGMYRLEEIQVVNPKIHRKSVKEIAFPPTGSLVIHRRNDEIFIPHGDTKVLQGDILTVIGNTTALTGFRKILE